MRIPPLRIIPSDGGMYRGDDGCVFLRANKTARAPFADKHTAHTIGSSERPLKILLHKQSYRSNIYISIELFVC